MSLQSLITGFMAEPREQAEVFDLPAAPELTPMVVRAEIVHKALRGVIQAVELERVPEVSMGHNYEAGYKGLQDHVAFDPLGIYSAESAIPQQRIVKHPLQSEVYPEAVVEVQQQPTASVHTTPELKPEDQKILNDYDFEKSDHQAWVELLTQAASESAKSTEESNAFITETTQRN